MKQGNESERETLKNSTIKLQPRKTYFRPF